VNKIVILAGTLAGALLALGPATAQAEEEKELGLNGRASLAFAQSRGNTDSQATNAEAELEYVTASPWVHEARFNFLHREEDDETTDERYAVRATSNYFWTEENFFFGRLDWRKDNFGGVREEWVPTVGLGRILLNTPRHSLRAEVSAGYRWADLADGTEEEGAALGTGARYRWNVSETTTFFQNALVQWSDDNTFIESETGLTANLYGNLHGRFTYLVRRNSDVPAGSRNSDFLTSIGLEYRF
jgi:putative salt-induced outer membrane protein